MEKLKVLYILNEAEELGGTSLSLENLMHSIQDRIEPILLLRSQGPVYDYFHEKGYECVAVPFRLGYITGKGWWRNLTYELRVWKNRSIRKKAVKKIVKLLKDRNIDLVHSNSSVVDLGSMIAKRLHVPHIWHLREFIDLGLGIEPIGGYAHWHKNVLAADAAIAISKQLYEHLEMKGHDNCYLLPDAVAPAAERIPVEAFEHQEIKKEKYFVFLAGRLHPIKSPELAVEAFSLSGLANKGYKLKLTGRCSENMRWKLTSLAGKFGSPAGIEFHDFTDDIKTLLSKASGFVICSRHEGLGRVMIEAMFYGCPVLAYASGPATDILTHGQTGLLFKTPEEGAAMMKKIADEDCMDMIRQAGDLAVSDFSEESYREQIWAIYEKVDSAHKAELAEKAARKNHKKKKKTIENEGITEDQGK